MGVVRKVFRYMWHTSIARLRLTLYKVDMVAWGTYVPKRLWFIVTWLRKLKTCKDVNIIYAVQDVGDQTPVSCICFFVCMVFCAANRLAVFPLWCCLLSGGFAFSVWRPDGSWNNHHLYALFEYVARLKSCKLPPDDWAHKPLFLVGLALRRVAIGFPTTRY